VSDSPPRIKFCGITNMEDAHLAADNGAWAIGLIFHPPSPRRCKLDEAAEIADVFRRRLEVFGVFVNVPLAKVAETADVVKLTGIQLHGDEGPSYCVEAGRRTGCKVMKAVQVRSRADVQSLRAFAVDLQMLDSGAGNVRGGSGKTFDWALAAGRRRRGTPLVLSGGLNAENVAEGIEVVQPWAVDVASGVEAEPGRKNPEKLAAFAAAVRGSAEGTPAAEPTEAQESAA
jgi:phosphoribosylanthranilate isomerase